MATITAGQVKELREKTGVGMMECKKALQESEGDLEKAILWLRERGMSRAAKKSGRVTAEGLVEALVNSENTRGVLLEVNCETDFVSKNDDFMAFTRAVAELALNNGIGEMEALKEAKLGSETVAQVLNNLIAKIGENLQLRRVQFFAASSGTVAGYLHMGGKIGSMVVIESASGSEAVEVGRDIAMHVAAASPRYLHSSEVSMDELLQEKELARKKLLEGGKPADMIEKIIIGQMNKFYKEVCLLDQGFVKDPETSITSLVSSKFKGASLSKFGRFQLGEGIEKRKDNFAEEVAAAQKL